MLAYSSRLSTGKMRIKSAKELTPGTRLTVKLEVVEPQASLSLTAIVVESKEVSGGHSALVSFDDEHAKQQLESFILGADPSEAARNVEPARRPLVLAVIDDSELQRGIASAPFLARGDTVLTANDGLAGLALCLQREPDVVLSDVQMPKADGWQLLRMLRAREALKHVPIIFLTTLSGEEDRLRGYRLGVDDYLAKPYSPDVLMARVDRVAQRKKVGAHSLAPGATNSLKGDLEHVSLPALLGFLEMERKSGILHLEPAGSVIQLRDGRPIRAKSPLNDSANKGEQAIFELLDQSRGRFEFVPSEIEGPDSIQMPLGFILMEHARLSDERAKHAPG
ncbi:MAG: hypothetical protein RJA70_1504 [Pseudomonadota bacterium]